MSHHFSNSHQAPLQPDHGRRQHIAGKKPTGLLICSKCHAVYHDKRWQWNADLLHQHQDHPDAQTVCPACKITRSEEAEGVLELAGFVSGGQKEEILHLIKNAGERATARDPLDRIYHWQDLGKRVVVYTTENQLAISLGKQVKRAYNGALEIKTSKDADVVRVEWQGWMG